MRILHRVLLPALLIALLASSTTAVVAQPMVSGSSEWAGAFNDVKDVPGLPRVLLIGDSISIYYTVPARKLLDGYANVHRIPVNARNTDFALEHLQEWLGTGKWDVIYFNFGLNDLITKPDGEHAVPLARYEKNLRELVRRLKVTGAALVWATTIPDPRHITAQGSPYKDTDIIAYNAAAEKIMKGIPIDDLYTYGPRSFRGSQPLGDADFKKGCDDLADQVAGYILLAEAFAPVKDEPGLPRVLLIGDSISYHYTYPTRVLLKGQANVHRVPVNGDSTDFALHNLPALLGTEKWDVIHFNWGLHDLVLKPDREHEVPLPQYEKNLRELIQQMKPTGATLVWASTTPIPPGPHTNYVSGSDAVYNAAALKIMNENHILVDDLYGFSMPRLSELQRPDDVHFSAFGGEVLAGQVAASIRSALATR